VSFWDALILETAIIAEATILYSEDFQDGAVFGGLRIVNPFK
jgi:predicted nucleic acid-binding protein